jgi:hypothetical protein
LFARVLIVTVVVAGCAGTSIDSHDYKRTCTADSDCALVYSGDLCAFCQCPNSGVATSDLAKFEADSTSRKGGCPKSTPPVDCEPCVAQVPFCLDGACTSHAQ